MKWSTILIGIATSLGVLCSLGMVRLIAHRTRTREREEMRRHVLRNYS